MEWKVAFPLHPEYRTLPMVWYVPPLSPIQSAAEAGKIGHRRRHAGRALAAHPAQVSRQPADRRRRGAGRRWRSSACWRCAPTCAPRPSTASIDEAHRRAGRPRPRSRSRRCTRSWRSPTTRTASSSRPRTARLGEDAYDLRGSCGFSFGNGCSDGESETNLFGAPAQGQDPDGGGVMTQTLQGAVGAADLSDAELQRGGAARSRAVLDAEAARARRRSRDRLDALLDEIADRRSLRPAGALRPAVRPHRSLSLHLFEHVHGESRDRGQAMVDLQGALREGRAGHRAPTSCPISCRCSSSSSRPGRRRGRANCSGRPPHILAALGRAAGSGGSRATRRCSTALVALAGQAAARDRGRAAGRARRGSRWTSPRSMRPGRRKRSGSVPARQAARLPAATTGLIAKLRHAQPRGQTPAPSPRQ